MSDQSYDEEDRQPKLNYLFKHGEYEFNLQVFEFETSSCSELVGSIKNAHEEIGHFEGYLSQRCWSNNFYTDCDSVSAEMQLISNVYFFKSGALRKEQWRDVLTNKDMEKYRMGGFLYVQNIFVKKEFRGNDLGLHYLRFVFESLKGKWNISVVKPGYLYKGEECTDLQIKHKQIVVLFLRLGYEELNSLRKHEYFYLTPDKLKNFGKKQFDIATIELPNSKGDDKNRNEKIEEFLVEVGRYEENEEKINALLKQFREDNMEMDLSTCGILHMAANHSSMYKLLEILLLPEYGLDVNALNNIGDTPLHAAARKGNNKAIRILLQQPSIELFIKSGEGLTPYEILTCHIESISCFWQAMEVTCKTKSVEEDYTMAFKIMPSDLKEQFIENLISKRMFERLKITAELQSDYMQDGMRNYNFTRGVREDVDDLAVDMHLFGISMPEEVVEGGVLKTFVSGFLQVLEIISYILKENKLPTVSRILNRVSVCWPPSYRYYFEHGGKVEYVLKGLFQIMFDNSYSNGDADFDDCFGEELEKLAEVEYFDTDYQYLNTVVLDHLLNN